MVREWFNFYSIFMKNYEIELENAQLCLFMVNVIEKIKEILLGPVSVFVLIL